MEVKAGYKQTEVGIIPEDWEVKPLIEIISKHYRTDLYNANLMLRSRWHCIVSNLQTLQDGRLHFARIHCIQQK